MHSNNKELHSDRPEDYAEEMQRCLLMVDDIMGFLGDLSANQYQLQCSLDTGGLYQICRLVTQEIRREVPIIARDK